MQSSMRCEPFVGSQRRKVMKTAGFLSMVLVAGLSVATWTSQATAAVKDAAAGREATMARCLLEVKEALPRKLQGLGQRPAFLVRELHA
jgi:hypothetical protein